MAQGDDLAALDKRLAEVEADRQSIEDEYAALQMRMAALNIARRQNLYDYIGLSERMKQMLAQVAQDDAATPSR